MSTRLDELVSGARRDVDPAELERLRAALAPSLGALPVARPSAAPVRGLLRPVTYVVLVGVLLAGVLLVVHSLRAPHAPPHVVSSAQSAAPRAPAPPREPPSVATPTPPAVPPPPESSHEASAPAPERPTTPSARRSVPDAPDPAAELALVERARRELGPSPARALATLDEHARRFPNGVLAEERELLAVEALAAEGHWDAAAARRRRFDARFPGSVHAPRLAELFAAHARSEGAPGGLPPNP